MPTKNVQMNSDEEVLKDFKEDFLEECNPPLMVKNQKTGDYLCTSCGIMPEPIADYWIEKLRSALSQARKDADEKARKNEREKCGREIVKKVVEVKDKYKNWTASSDYNSGGRDASKEIEKIVSSITRLNEK